MFERYSEAGFSVIPTYKTGKNPTISGWQKYCHERPTAALIAAWERQFDGGTVNMGLACGPASGIIALDIDTDDKEILHLCPPSPCVKRGSKGETRFFKYSPLIKSQSIPMLDILSDGRQTIMPPSIHPLTKKPYHWLSPDTILDGVNLPELDLSFLEHFKRSPKVGIPVTGRNNKLVDIITSMRGRGESEPHIVDEVYRWDLDNNVPRLFMDQGEQYKAKSEAEAKAAAWKMVNSVTASMLRSNLAVMEHDGALAIEVSEEQIEREKFSCKAFPEPIGLLADVKDLINQYSVRDMPNLALGGAIALVASLACNRYRIGNIWPNVYVINLAATGCVDADTEIRVNRAKIGYKVKIKKEWQNQTKGKGMGGRKRKIGVPTMVRGLKSKNQIGLIESGGVVHSGFKPCVQLTSESGRTLILTADHLVYSRGTWVKAEHMGGLQWGVDSPHPKKKKEKQKKLRDNFVCHLKFHPFARVVNSKASGPHKRIESHRAIYESNLNGLTLIEFKTILRTDENLSSSLKFMNPQTHCIHHVDFDHYNNEIENLACVTKEEHLKIHADYSNFSQGKITWETVVKVESVGEREVFDVVDTESQSFTANDVVVHNSGKSFPQSILKLILADKMGCSLMGFGDYRSSAAFVKNLVTKRERLDIIDEVSGLFAQMKDGGLYQTEIQTLMCKVWSESNQLFLGAEYAEREDTSTCYNPCVSILGSSTIENLKTNMNKKMLTGGLVPRLLIFSHESYGRLKESVLNDVLLRRVVDRCESIYKVPRREADTEADIRYRPVFDPIDLAPRDPATRAFLTQVVRDYNERISDASTSEVMRNMLTRAGEQVSKLALIHAVGRADGHGVEQIDVEWGRATFDVCLHNSSLFVEETATDGKWEQDSQRVMTLFKKHSFLSRRDLARHVRVEPTRLKQLLDSLVAAERIQPATSKVGAKTKPFHGFQITNT